MTASRDARGRWLPGRASPNPKGRPPAGESFAELLRAAGTQEHPKGGTYRERLVRVAWEQACVGDHASRVWIVERLEGKVADRVRQDVNLTGALATIGADIDLLTREEREAIRRALVDPGPLLTAPTPGPPQEAEEGRDGVSDDGA